MRLKNTTQNFKQHPWLKQNFSERMRHVTQLQEILFHNSLEDVQDAFLLLACWMCQLIQIVKLQKALLMSNEWHSRVNEIQVKQCTQLRLY